MHGRLQSSESEMKDLIGALAVLAGLSVHLSAAQTTNTPTPTVSNVGRRAITRQ